MENNRSDSDIRVLVDAVLAGDTEQFMHIVKLYEAPLFAYFSGQIRDPHTVEELAQDTLMAAFQNLIQFKSETNFKQWIYAIARNKLMSHLRDMYRSKELKDRLRAEVLMDISEDLHEAASSGSSELLDRLRECLGKLTDKVRNLVTVRYFERVPVKTIATRMHTSANAVSSALSRTRAKLETCMNEPGEA